MPPTTLRTVPRAVLAIAPALAAAVVALGPQRARAQPLAGAVIVTGKVDPHARQVIATTIAAAVKDAAWPLAAAAFSAGDIDQITGCLAADHPWPCISPTAAARGVERLVIVQAHTERAGRASELVLTGELVVAGDGIPSIERQSCTRCGDDELARIASQLAAKLLDNTASRARATQRAAATPAPGARTASPDGPATAVAVARAPGGPRWVPVVLVGGGVVAAVAGSIISYRDEPGPLDQRHKYVYNGPALGVAAAGAIAAGIGAYLWLRSRRGSAPVLAPLAGGISAGWMARF